MILFIAASIFIVNLTGFVLPSSEISVRDVEEISTSFMFPSRFKPLPVLTKMPSFKGLIIRIFCGFIALKITQLLKIELKKSCHLKI